MACNNSVLISNLIDIWGDGSNQVGIGLDITDTSSADGSDFLRLSSSGIKKFAVDKYGAIHQTFLFNGTPTISDFPNSGSWGMYNDTTTSDTLIFYNNGTGIETIGGSAISIFDEGSLLGNNITGFNFIGGGVMASLVGRTANITIASGLGGGGSGTPLEIKDEGSSLHPDVASIDFIGSNLTATAIGNAVTVSGSPSFTGVLTDASLTGDGLTTNLGVSFSAFTGVLTDGSITGDGLTTNLGVSFSAFTGVLTDGSITGDGLTTNLGALISTDGGNIVIAGVDGGIYSSGISNIPIAVFDEGALISSSVTGFDFVGGSVSTSLLGQTVTVNITGAGGGGGSGMPLEIKDEGMSLHPDVASIDFVGNNLLVTTIGNAITVTSDSSLTSLQYYYGHTATGFVATGTDDFFADANYIEDDTYGFSDNINTLTIPKSAEYSVDIQGSISNTANGETLSLLNSGVTIASVDLQDLGGDDLGAAFALTFQGTLTIGETLQLTRANSGIYHDIMFRVLESAPLNAGSGTPLEVKDEGISLHTDVASIDFIGSNLTATAIGNAVTISGSDSFTGVVTDGSLTGNGLTTNLGVSFSAFTGVLTDASITGDGLTTNLGVSFSAFTGVLTDASITGDGLTTNLGTFFSADGGNIVTTGVDGGIYSSGISNIPIAVFDEGALVSSSVTGFDFVGGSVSTSLLGQTVTVNITGVGGGGGGSGMPLEIKDEGISLHADVASIDFIGSSLIATAMGNAITVSGSDSFTGVLTDNSITGNGFTTNLGFDSSQTYTFGIQQYEWTSMTSEAVIDISGSSPSQTTTLTANQVLSFTGSVPGNKDRVYYAEVTTTGYALSLSTGNDPGAFFIQPSYSPFVVAFKVLSDGTPRFAGVI